MPPPSHSKSGSTPSPLLVLSESDVKRLLSEDSPDVRIEVLTKVAQGHNERSYSLREFAIAEQIFRALVKDSAIRVRETLAMLLKDNAQVSRDIILALMRDEDTVALPLIESSPILTDEDLMRLIASAKNATRVLAVARRKSLSETVSKTLLETRNGKVISELMRNKDAAIPGEAYSDIVRDYAKDPEVMEALAQRQNLPLTVVEKVIVLVSDALAERLRSAYNIAPSVIASETEKAREIATLQMVDEKIHNRDVEKLIDQLQAFGRLTPSIILTSLCRGNLYFFETSLARLSAIPVRNAQLLIHDKGGLGFKALYGKAGLPDKFFAACKLLLEVIAERPRGAQEETGAYANEIVQKLFAKVAGKPVENLAYIIALIRQSA